jgi:hypothetical protein
MFFVIERNKFKLDILFLNMDDSQNYDESYNDSGLRIRSVEEKQRILKDRLILIGQNLIDTKEKISQDILGIKKEIEILKQHMERTKIFLETASKEFSKFAKKEDLEILSKQAKMFQPLDFIESPRL